MNFASSNVRLVVLLLPSRIPSALLVYPYSFGLYYHKMKNEMSENSPK